MNNKYFTTILIILALILLGIFTAWLLVSRGYVQLNPNDNSNTAGSTTSNSIFPSSNDSGSADSGNGFGTTNNLDATSSNIILSGGQLGKLLSKLDTRPIGDLLTVGRSTSTILFFERATGHLFQIPPDGSPFRISNTTMPKVVLAWGGVQGSTTNFIIRTNNNQLETKFASLTNNSATSSSSLFLGTEEEVGGMPQTLTIKPTPTNAFDFAISPLENQVAHLEHSAQGTNLIISDWSGSKREKVASLPLIQTVLDWPASTTIAIGTKANYASDGLLYFYNLKTKKLEKIMGGVKGLSVKVSPDARYVLYSGSSNNTLFAALYDRRTGKIDRLPFKTLAEKCVWANKSDIVYCGAPTNTPSGNYPDAWYQGLISLADNLWELEIETKKATILFNPELNNLGETIDATRLILDESDQQLYFVNKNDFSLWRLSLGTKF
jgi:hypothetical protein